MDYKVEKEFIHKELKCVVLALNIGHRCGYVGINNNHLLYGLNFLDKHESLTTGNMNDITMENAGLGQMLSEMLGEYNNDYISPKMYFNVHGGITYSGGGQDSKYPIETDLWWFGYDCDHYNDAKDFSIMSEEYDYLKEMEIMYPTDGTVKTLGYCIEECKQLAEQLMQIKN